MGKSISRRAEVARQIRRRADRALRALEKDLAAGVVSAEFAGVQRNLLKQVKLDNSYDRSKRGYSVASAEAARRKADAVFDVFSAQVSREFARTPQDMREAFTRRREAASFRRDFEASLRGDISTFDDRETSAFLQSTKEIWEGLPPEARLSELAEVLGEGDLEAAFNAWKEAVGDSSDFWGASRAAVYKRVEALHFEKADTEFMRLQKEFEAQYKDIMG